MDGLVQYSAVLEIRVSLTWDPGPRLPAFSWLSQGSLLNAVLPVLAI